MNFDKKLLEKAYHIDEVYDNSFTGNRGYGIKFCYKLFNFIPWSTTVWYGQTVKEHLLVTTTAYDNDMKIIRNYFNQKLLK